jgi:hypothetical protein
MNKVKLYILGLSYSQTQAGAYALVLAEERGNRRIPIIIGAPEAQSIAIQLEGLRPNRPLTHDLFLSFATSFAITVIEVNIYKLEEGIFYSEMVCDNGATTIRIDARASDAIALALRFKCPIYTTTSIIEKAGIVIDNDKNSDKNNRSDNEEINEYDSYTMEELEDLLNIAIKEENYEQASVLRDEIKSRKDEMEADEL